MAQQTPSKVAFPDPLNSSPDSFLSHSTSLAFIPFWGRGWGTGGWEVPSPGTHLCGLLPNFIYNAVPLISSLLGSHPHNSKSSRKKKVLLPKSLDTSPGLASIAPNCTGVHPWTNHCCQEAELIWLVRLLSRAHLELMSGENQFPRERLRSCTRGWSNAGQQKWQCLFSVWTVTDIRSVWGQKYPKQLQLA